MGQTLSRTIRSPSTKARACRRHCARLDRPRDHACAGRSRARRSAVQDHLRDLSFDCPQTDQDRATAVRRGRAQGGHIPHLPVFRRNEKGRLDLDRSQTRHLYQGAVILTYEDWPSRPLAHPLSKIGSDGAGDVVHSRAGATRPAGGKANPAGDF